jgi:hypothetical protein
MSITIHTQPLALTPVYNQMIIALTSSYQSSNNFQFISDIYVNGEYISRMKVPVNPDGYGVFDIHRHVESEIDYNFNPESFDWSPATQSYATYSCIFSEEFRYTYTFTDNAFLSNGKVGFVSQEEPLFDIGDEIIISQTAPYTNYSYEGLTTVVDITQSGLTWSVETAKSFGDSTPPEPGTITLANYELTTIAGTLSTGTLEAWNGVFNFQDFINYDRRDYLPNTTTPGKWLTNVPTNYKIGTQSRMKLQLYKDAINEQKEFYVKTNNTGTFRITSAYSSGTPLGNNALTQIACGPWDLTNNGQVGFTASIVTGTSSLPIFDENTTSYEIWTQNQILQQDMATMSFIINQDCSRYEKIQLVFMDKLGSFIPFVFDRVNKNNKTISRTNYQQVYGQYAPAAQSWGYNTYDRGMKNLDTVVTENYKVNSNWVDQSTSNFLMELFESPQVYWINEDGLTQAINITSTSTERKQTINDQIINYTLTFMLANKSQSQRG